MHAIHLSKRAPKWGSYHCFLIETCQLSHSLFILHTRSLLKRAIELVKWRDSGANFEVYCQSIHPLPTTTDSSILSSRIPPCFRISASVHSRTSKRSSLSRWNYISSIIQMKKLSNFRQLPNTSSLLSLCELLFVIECSNFDLTQFWASFHSLNIARFVISYHCTALYVSIPISLYFYFHSLSLGNKNHFVFVL